MSQIEKLSVRGIRSFNPQTENHIRFFSPLTIIVGHNGAGKTTIIECLKYATTGDLPPNSKNGAFIYDPKLAHESEVKAQVKLEFRNVNGKEIVCTRSMSLTQGKSSVSQRTLESLLLVKDPLTGQKHSLSTRCAELDIEMPLQLGVPKAILDNVIFCHQEESFWPLSEPSTLKKKFDEIFASTKYTKALDSIKSFRKEQVIALKLAQNNVSHLKEKRGKARRVAESLTLVEGKLETAQSRIEALDSGEIETTVQEMTDLMEQNRRVQEARFKVQQAESERGIIEKSIGELKAGLQEYAESDEELQTLLSEYDSSLEAKDSEHYQLEQQATLKTADIAELQAEHSRLSTKLGQLQAEREAHERRLTERNALITEISHEQNYTGFERPPFSESTIESFIQKLQGDINDRTAGLDGLKLEIRDRENIFLSELQVMKTNVASVEETKKMLRKQMDATRQKQATCMRDMQNINVTQTEIDDLESRSMEESMALDQAKKQYNHLEIEQKIRKLNSELQKCEYELTKAGDEILVLNMQLETRAKLAVKKGEVERKEEAITKSLVVIQSEMTSLLGRTPDSPSMDRAVSEFCLQKQKDVKMLEDQWSTSQQALSSVDAKLSIARGNLKTKVEELEEKRNRIKAVADDKDYPDALAKAEKELIDGRDEVASMRSAGSMYSKFINRYNSSKCCPLCVRPFDGTDGEAFLQKLQIILERVPEATKAADHQLAITEQRKDRLAQLRSVYDDLERLRDREVPAIEAKIEEYTLERVGITSTAEDMKEKLTMVRLDAQNAETLKEKVSNYTRQQRELEILKREVDRITQELSSSSGSDRTMEEVQRVQEEWQDKSKSIRREIDRLNSESRMRQKEITAKESRVRDIREQLQRATFQFREREKLAKSVGEYRAEIETLRKEIETVEQRALEQMPAIHEKEAELGVFRRSMSTKESEYLRRVNALQQSMGRVRDITNELNRYLRSNADSQLTQTIDRSRQITTDMAVFKSEIAALQDQIQAIRDHKADVNHLRRQIEDNIKYRKLVQESLRVGERARKLKEEVAGLDQRSIEERYTRLKRRHEHLVGERAGLVGESKQLSDQKLQLQRELTGDYKNMESLYRAQLISLRTEEMAHADLDKYAKALDAAIMKYHSLKMDDINKIIRELWVNTYQGSDIDTIEIRSDNENVKGNRTYNYRVVMLKGDIVLDMRGRCSAGQKVLTSLIIRLALAETFCLNCGILALDEPTTNLDRENIESLAESLAHIIKIRRQQSNFQLVIITHDEEFMQLLGKSEYADYYFRVAKDEDGFSVITQHSVQES